MRSKISLHRCTESESGCSGVITVFLAIAFACIVSLILALTESARTAGIRCYAQTAAGAAIDSLFSEYSNKMWDEYGLLFLVEGDETVIRSKILEYMEPYTGTGGWFAIEPDRVELIKVTTAVSDGGEWLEQEIADHLIYGGLAEALLDPGSEQDREDQEKVMEEVREARSVQEISEDFARSMDEIEKLEDYVEKIDRNLKDQKIQEQAVRIAISCADSSGFKRALGNLRRLTGVLSSLAARFAERADILDEHLSGKKADHAGEMEEMTEENRALLDRQIEAYREYSRQNGERRETIEGLAAFNEVNSDILDAAQEKADEVEARLDAMWQEAWRDAEERRKNGEKNVRMDTPDSIGEWACVAEVFDDFFLPAADLGYGTGDRHNESLLKKARNFLAKGLTGLCVPASHTVSDGVIADTLLPSNLCRELRSGETPDIIRRILIDKYISMYFDSYTDPAAISESGKSLRYETEYILSGKTKDKENLESVLGEIFAVRGGLNLMHLMKDPELTEEVRALARTIAAGAGMPPLELVLEAFIYTVWSGAEAVLDIRDLLEGKTVPLVKESGDWHLSAEGLLNFGESGILEKVASGSKTVISGEDGIESGGEVVMLVAPQPGNDEDRAPDYEDYLSMLLKLLDCEDKNYRMMDLIQDNIRRSDEYFLISEAVYGIEMDAVCKAEHSFSGSGTYEVKVHAAKAY